MVVWGLRYLIVLLEEDEKREFGKDSLKGEGT